MKETNDIRQARYNGQVLPGYYVTKEKEVISTRQNPNGKRMTVFSRKTNPTVSVRIGETTRNIYVDKLYKDTFTPTTACNDALNILLLEREKLQPELDRLTETLNKLNAAITALS